jgi:hypothetical protein
MFHKTKIFWRTLRSEVRFTFPYFLLHVNWTNQRNIYVDNTRAQQAKRHSDITQISHLWMQLKISLHCSEGPHKCFWSTVTWMQPTPAHSISLRYSSTLSAITCRYFKMASSLWVRLLKFHTRFTWWCNEARKGPVYYAELKTEYCYDWVTARKENVCGIGVNVWTSVWHDCSFCWGPWKSVWSFLRRVLLS